MLTEAEKEELLKERERRKADRSMRETMGTVEDGDQQQFPLDDDDDSDELEEI